MELQSSKFLRDTSYRGITVIQVLEGYKLSWNYSHPSFGGIQVIVELQSSKFLRDTSYRGITVIQATDYTRHGKEYPWLQW